MDPSITNAESGAVVPHGWSTTNRRFILDIQCIFLQEINLHTANKSTVSYIIRKNYLIYTRYQLTSTGSLSILYKREWWREVGREGGRYYFSTIILFCFHFFVNFRFYNSYNLWFSIFIWCLWYLTLFFIEHVLL